jgi:hypothetical protein
MASIITLSLFVYAAYEVYLIAKPIWSGVKIDSKELKKQRHTNMMKPETENR